MFWPVMQCGRVEIGSTRPFDGVDLRIQTDLGKPRRVSQRSIEFSFQNRLEIDCSQKAVVELQAQ